MFCDRGSRVSAAERFGVASADERSHRVRNAATEVQESTFRAGWREALVCVDATLQLKWFNDGVLHLQHEQLRQEVGSLKGS